MPDADRVIAERIHALVSANAPELDAKTWYGMPAYARDGQVICFFQPASKFKARYGTFGFNDGALLDDGSVWATSFAVAGLAEADEAFLGELIRRAVSWKPDAWTGSSVARCCCDRGVSEYRRAGRGRDRGSTLPLPGPSGAGVR